MRSAATAFQAQAEAAGSLAAELPWWGWADERTCLTRRGELVTLARLTPRSTSGLSHDRVTAVAERWCRLLGQLDERTRLSLYALRRPLAWSPDGARGVAGESARARAEFLSLRCGALEVYAAWARDPRLTPAGSRGGGWVARARSWLAGGNDRPVWIRNQIDAACDRLRQDVDALRAMVSDVTPLEILPSAEATAVLADLVNRPGTPAPPPRGSALHWRLALSEVEAERRHLRLDGEDALVYSLLEPPSECRADQLRELLRIPAVLTLAWEFRRLSTDRARKRIQTARTHFFSQRFSFASHMRETQGTSEAMLDEAADLEASRLGGALVELEAEGMPYGELSISLTLHGPLERIERRDADVRRAFATCDAKVIREGYGQLAAWFARLPGQQRSRQLRNLLVSGGVAAALAPLCGAARGSPRSKHLDDDCLCVLETAERTPYFFDLFGGGGGDVGHTLVLGQTGSGKSFLLNFLLVSALQYGPRVSILDLGGSYRALTELLGGSYLQLSPDESAPTRLRPFALPAGERTFQFLTGWVRRLMQLGGHRESGSDSSEIRDRVEDLYKFAPAERRLGVLRQSLPAAMWPAMTRWCRGGAWGEVFDNGADGADEWDEWQVIDLASASQHEDLTEAALAYYLERMRHEIDDPAETARVKLAVVDEAWRFLRDANVSAYLAEAAKTWRKKNAALLLATQSGADLADLGVARGLLEATPTRLFLANPEFPDSLADPFQLSSDEVLQIRRLAPKLEIYLRRPTEAEVLRLRVDPKSYWLYTSSPRDAALRARAVKELGLPAALRKLAKGEYR